MPNNRHNNGPLVAGTKRRLREWIADGPVAVEYPTDWSRGLETEHSFDTVVCDIANKLKVAIRLHEREAACCVDMAWSAFFAELLRRYGGQDEVVIAHCDDHAAVPIRWRLSADATLQSLLRDHAVSTAEIDQGIELDWFRAELDIPIDQPVFRIGVGTLRGAIDEPWELFLEIANGQLKLSFNTALHLCESAEQLLRRLMALALAWLEHPTDNLASHGLVTDAEHVRLIGEWAGHEVEYPSDSTVCEVFAQVVASHADEVALESAAETVTYAELDRQSEQLARYLLERGARPGDRIAICLDRSAAYVTACLATLRLGGCYVPLDAKYPADRIEYMLEDSGCRLLITAEQMTLGLASQTLDSIESLLLDHDHEAIASATAELPLIEVAATDPIYVAYTSGSTGRPKGVEVAHRGVLRLTQNVDWIAFGPEERILCFNSHAFDVSGFEMYGAVLNGATYVIPPPGLLSMHEVATFIEQRALTTIMVTAALLHELVDHHLEKLRSVRCVSVGGDVLSPSHVHKMIDALPDTVVLNSYGPTENTAVSTVYPVTRHEQIMSSVPIGRPICNSYAYVLDQNRNLVPPGMIGELYVGGDGVALGYVNRPDLTAEKFMPDPFSGKPGNMYRTGDLVRHRHDGQLEFFGRVDTQVKISGVRIELGEIESVIRQHPDVSDAAVVAVEGQRMKRLVAFVVGSTEQTSAAELRDFIAGRVPQVMVPGQYVFMDALPLTANGKVDRRALPNPEAHASRVVDQPSAERPGDQLQGDLSSIWKQLLGVPEIGLDDRFFDLGGNSLLSLHLVEEIAQLTGQRISVVRIFEYPTIRSLAEYLQDGGREQGAGGRLKARLDEFGRRDSVERDAIAIIGMAGRFPGASNVRQMWQNLLDGRDTTRSFASDEIDPDVPPKVRNHPKYVPVRGVLEHADLFDAQFFGISPAVAEFMDPQQRLLLETAWEAIEDAGYAPDAEPGPVAVFTGIGNNSYFIRNVLTNPEAMAAFGDTTVQMVNEKDYGPMLVSHRLGLTGPAISVHTACSTSLVAVIQACHSLQSGECDMALAGGAAVRSPINSGHVYEEGAMFSADGHTRTFDASSSGTVFSDGSAIVVLRRLRDAEAAGDHIHAVIRGTGLSNDGGQRASFSAPTVEGQSIAIARALADANWDAGTIGYLEAHGTGTPLGDPIEVEALARAFKLSTDKKNYCGIGSIKSNFGHLTAAAGTAGLIKAVLAVERGVIPATLHFENPNPKIDFESTPFYVAAERQDWHDDGRPRRAGVSSMGMGGTNAHVVIEQYRTSTGDDSLRRDAGMPCLLAISGRSADRVQKSAENLAEFLAAGLDMPLGSVAYTLLAGRTAFDHRGYVVATSADDAATKLRAALVANKLDSARTNPPVVFLFPGQGVQYPGMGSQLYSHAPIFRQALDACLEILEGLDIRLRDLLLPSATVDVEAAASALSQTSMAQPAIVAVEYALGCLWRSLGVEPAAMMGHSVGEFTAVCLAGALSIEDTLRAVAERGRLMQSQDAGAMLSVRSPVEIVLPLMPDSIDLAAVNAPKLCVVAGPTDEIDAFHRELEQRGMAAKLMTTSHAFHSGMMGPATEPFRQWMSTLVFRDPSIPVVSSSTGTWMPREQMGDPAYWAEQIRNPVQFSKAVETLQDGVGPVFLEVGPRMTATALTRQCLGRRGTAIASLDMDSHSDEGSALLAAVGSLWVHDVHVDVDQLIAARDRRRVSLPTYPFNGKRYWMTPGVAPQTANEVPIGQAQAGNGVNVNGAAGLIAQQLEIIERQIDLIERRAELARDNRSPAKT